MRLTIPVTSKPCRCSIEPVGAIVTETGELCVMPFVYKGKLYNECVKEESSPSWCSILNDAQGVVIRKGICKKDSGKGTRVHVHVFVCIVKNT